MLLPEDPNSVDGVMLYYFSVGHMKRASGAVGLKLCSSRYILRWRRYYVGKCSKSDAPWNIFFCERCSSGW